MEKQKNGIDLSIIIVNYNSSYFLLNTVDSIVNSHIKASYEIIIADNNSSDNSLELVRAAHENLKIIDMGENTGFSKANNAGFNLSRGRYILILNSDTIIPEKAVDSLLKMVKEESDTSLIAPLLLNADGSVQLSVGKDLTLINEFLTKFFFKMFFRLYSGLRKKNIELDVDWVSGACFIVPREIYTKVGGFDEKFFLYFEDADLCLRIRKAGYKVHLTSRVSITHLMGKSTSSVFNSLLPEIKKGQLYYYKKHNSKFDILFLRLYLKLKFSIRFIFEKIAGDKKKASISKKILKLTGRYK